MMIIMLRHKKTEVDDSHRLLETRVQSGAGEFGGGHTGEFFDNRETGVAEVLQNFRDRAGVVIRFVGFAVLEVGGVKSFGAAGIIVEALVPQRFEII